MRTVLCLFLSVAICAISGCTSLDDYLPDTKSRPEENMHPDVELQGVHYAKLNSIGCLNCSDMETAKSGDVDMIDNLIRQKQCFVIPTGTDVFIKERVKGDIVSAMLKGSTQIFYTLKSNLVAY
jgi:hypothetical protein